jgi:hypothetical protein
LHKVFQRLPIEPSSVSAAAGHDSCTLDFLMLGGGPMKIIGVVLVVLGLVGLTYGGITWTRPTTVVDLGSVKVTHDKTESLPLPPLAGGLSLAAGTALLVIRPRRQA